MADLTVIDRSYRAALRALGVKARDLALAWSDRLIPHAIFDDFTNQHPPLPRLMHVLNVNGTGVLNNGFHIRTGGNGIKLHELRIDGGGASALFAFVGDTIAGVTPTSPLNASTWPESLQNDSNFDGGAGLASAHNGVPLAPFSLPLGPTQMERWDAFGPGQFIVITPFAAAWNGTARIVYSEFPSN